MIDFHHNFNLFSLLLVSNLIVTNWAKNKVFFMSGGLEDVFLEEKCHIILLYFNQDLHESAQKWTLNTLQNKIYYAWCGPCL